MEATPNPNPNQEKRAAATAARIVEAVARLEAAGFMRVTVTKKWRGKLVPRRPGSDVPLQLGRQQATVGALRTWFSGPIPGAAEWLTWRRTADLPAVDDEARRRAEFERTMRR